MDQVTLYKKTTYLGTTGNIMGFPGDTVVKSPPADAGDAGDLDLIPGSGRSPGRRNGNPLLYSCLNNPMDRGAWWATVHGVAQSGARLSATLQPLRHGRRYFASLFS